MLNPQQNRKCGTDMGIDNSLTFGGCPKAKKSKTSKYDHSATETTPNNAFSNRNITHSQWDILPSVLLHDIFDLLSKEDRKNASLVCKNWRRHSFYPKWWPSMTFKIEEHNIQKAQFYRTVFGSIVSNVTIKLNSLSHQCMIEFITLLEVLSDNNHLKELVIEPTHCRFEIPKRIQRSNGADAMEIVKLLQPCLSKLTKFSIGCIDDLSCYVKDILASLSAEKVTHLGLASVKDDPSYYQVSYFNPDYILPFKNLKVLSIDYDQLSDKFLYNLEHATDLERLVVHLHGIRQNHPGTTAKAWKDFHRVHPLCEFRLTVIHAFNDIEKIHEKVLRKHMPLTHLKVFFCESINLTVLEFLSANYHKTLRSIMWIDSHGQHDGSWIIAKSTDTPDPLVLMAWLCKKLEELVLLGYKYFEENLVAIGRLRGEMLKKLEIAEEDILSDKDASIYVDALIDIPKSIKKPWAPLRLCELHPVICNPTAGDSDEYLLPIVLADLH